MERISNQAEKPAGEVDLALAEAALLVTAMDRRASVPPVAEWGPQHLTEKASLDTPEGLTYSA